MALLALVGTGVLFLPRLHTEFFPKIDAGNFTMMVSAPEGSRIEKTTAIVAEIERLVQETIPKEELEEVISNTGLYYGDAARFAPNTGNHTAFVLVNLVTGHEGTTNDYMAALRKKLAQALPGVEIVVSDRRHHQRRAEFRLARPNRHSGQRAQPGPHPSGGGRHQAESGPSCQYDRCAHQAG